MYVVSSRSLKKHYETDSNVKQTVLNRMAFGMRGTYIPIFIVFIGGFVYVSIIP